MELVMVDAEGVEMHVEVERDGSSYLVRIGDDSYEVDAVSSSEVLRSLLIGGEQHELAVERTARDRYRVSGIGVDESFQVSDPLAHLSRISGHHAGDGPRRVEAYMPGRVVAILVAAGEEVEAGQGVVVLEAMKMENEIQADVAGVVTDLLVEEGQSVEGGDPLFEVTPA